MHTKNNYQFATQAEAQEFVDLQGGDPSADVYVSGPTLIDERETFKNMDWVIPADPYWFVSVEVYK